ncbi:hypothetical protein G7Y89_g10841 [Cudoniella acicularis]|uniref:Aminoglycoside phosphotransferase domain-containing protein n=1 Tax=Cudoniella acicularis TaxID=354080 RepID=A0A8H4RC04_9HELO|nr:hypothetical protein G7Y89_g10841 [Cudoniella acicularis]
MATMPSDEILVRVQESLKNGPYVCSSLVKLAGGTANFLYRGTLANPLEDGSKTIIIKHTESYVASNVAFKLTSTRCGYEQAILKALETFPPVTNSEITVTTPKLYSFIYENDTGTQIYSDLPSSADLKTYALTHALMKEQCSRLGYSIGAWAKAFHIWAAAPEQKELREKMKGNTAMKELKYRLNYTNLVATIDNFPEILEASRGVFEEVAKETKEELDREEGSLIHGDFWSGNVLLPNTPLPDASHPLNVYIIDWELSHLSHPAFDLGQMFAELYELKHFKDIDAGVWLIESFLRGYGKLSLEMASKTAVHVGAHLVCWGSRVQGWGTKEQVEGVVEIGREFVRKGWEEDVEWFEGGPLESNEFGKMKWKTAQGVAKSITPRMSPSILVFGATGLMGSHLISFLKKTIPTLSLTVCIRNNSSTLLDYLNNTVNVNRIANGDFSEHDKISQLAAEHDIVINCGSSWDVPLTKTIINGLTKRFEEGRGKGSLIHVSGTGNFVDGRRDGKFAGPGTGGSKVWNDDDEEDMKLINTSMLNGGPDAE